MWSTQFQGDPALVSYRMIDDGTAARPVPRAGSRRGERGSDSAAPWGVGVGGAAARSVRADVVRDGDR